MYEYAHQRQGRDEQNACADRGGVSVGEQELDAVVQKSVFRSDERQIAARNIHARLRATRYGRREPADRHSCRLVSP